MSEQTLYRNAPQPPPPSTLLLTSENVFASNAYGSGCVLCGAELLRPLAEPFDGAKAADVPDATIEAADTPAVFIAESGALAAVTGGRRGGAFILGHATPARLKLIMIHWSCSRALGGWKVEKFEGGFEGGGGDFTEMRGCVIIFSQQKYRLEGCHHTFDSMLPYLM